MMLFFRVELGASRLLVTERRYNAEKRPDVVNEPSYGARCLVRLTLGQGYLSLTLDRKPSRAFIWGESLRRNMPRLKHQQIN